MFECLAPFSKKLDSQAIVVHSDLSVIGRELSKYRGKLLETFFEETDFSTVYIPTFSYYGIKGKPFRVDDLAVKMGAFSAEAIDYVRANSAYRLSNPIHSYTEVGTVKPRFKKCTIDRSFGSGTAFDYFTTSGAIWCSLGCDIHDGFTILHHAETLAAVPYRKWITLTRTVLLDGIETKVRYSYFDKREPMVFDFTNIIDLLIQKGVITRFSFGSAFGFIGRVEDIVSIVVPALKENPYLIARPTEGIK